MKSLLLVFSFILLYSCESPQVQKADPPAHPTLKISNKIDPICKMDVQKEYSDTLLHKGEIIGFCSIVCKERFIEKIKEDPLK